MFMFDIYQGDQYGIRVKIFQDNDGAKVPITPTDVDNVEIIVGSASKVYSDGGVTFDSNTNEWIYGLIQADSFAMNSSVPIIARVKIDGEIFSIDFGTYKIKSVLTRRML